MYYDKFIKLRRCVDSEIKKHEMVMFEIIFDELHYNCSQKRVASIFHGFRTVLQNRTLSLK